MKIISTMKDLKDFWDVFYNCYGEGIYIKCDIHPCGWDWVNLRNFYDIYDMIDDQLSVADFSGGYYDFHPYDGYTPFEMLKDLGKNWCFERNDIDWL